MSEEKIRIEFACSEGIESQLDTIRVHWKVLFPLVENAFKYTKSLIGRIDDESPSIAVHLTLEQADLIFRIINTYSKSEKPAGSRQGIINLKKRLNLLYPNDNWKLEQSYDGNHWVSSLILPIKNK